MGPVLGILGRAIGVAGAALLAGALFTPWYELPLVDDPSAWELFQVADVLLTVVAVVAAALLVAGVFVAAELTALVALAGGAFAMGMSAPVESLDFVGYGTFLAFGASVVLAVGASLAFLSSRQRAPASAPALALPPPGWYPDPSGHARERLWSGARWTDETRV